MWELIYLFFFLSGGDPLEVQLPGYVTQEECVAAGWANEAAATEVGEAIGANQIVFVCVERDTGTPI